MSPRMPKARASRLAGAAQPMRVTGARVSAELLSILGVHPAVGRWFRTGEDVAPHDGVVIISHGLWVTRFRSDPAIAGRFVELDGVQREVVGVMPASFKLPVDANGHVGSVGPRLPKHHRLLGRRLHADRRPVAQRHVPGTGQRPTCTCSNRGSARAFRGGCRRTGTSRLSFPLRDAIVGGVKSRLGILFGAVALVLVIACANVANLSLAARRSTAARDRRSNGNRRVASAHRATTADREHRARQSRRHVRPDRRLELTLAFLKIVLPPETPRLFETHLDARALLYTGVISILTGCAFGLAPVATVSRLRLRTVLDSGGRSGGSVIAGPGAIRAGGRANCLRRLLVIAAGLLVRSLWSLWHVDPGFRPDGIVTARVTPPQSLCAVPDRCLGFYHDLHDRLNAATGVQASAFVNTLPLTGAVAKRSLAIEGYTVPAGQSAPLFWLNVTTPGYFETMNIPVISGRAFARADLTGPPVVLIDASTAQRFWKGETPIDRRVRFIGEDQSRTVIGVVADVRAHDLSHSVPEWMVGTAVRPTGVAWHARGWTRAYRYDGRRPHHIRTWPDRDAAAAATRRGQQRRRLRATFGR